MQSLVIAESGALPHKPDDLAARLYEAFLAGRSPNTRDAYAHDLTTFATFSGKPSAASALTTLLALPHGDANGVLLSYRAHMAEAGLTPATTNRRLAAFVQRSNWRERSACRPGFQKSTASRRRLTGIRSAPGVEGTRAMLAKAKDQKPAKALRDAALIRLFFDLALRRGEVAALDLHDIDCDGRRVWIKGKGRAQKEQRTLPQPTLQALIAWIEVRATIVGPDEPALFVGLSDTARGHRITGRGLYHVIAELGHDVGIRTRPHGLRHASITAALDANGGDVRAVQQHARHANPQTTIKYDDNRRDLAGKIAAGLASIL